MRRPRLIAIDLDGTLLDAQGLVGPRTRRAVARAQAAGAIVVPCTGRPPRMTAAIARELGTAVAIVYNGAARHDFSADVATIHHEFGRGAAHEVAGALRVHDAGVELGIETASGWYVDPALHDRSRDRLAREGLPPPDGVGAIEDFLAGGAIKIFARHEHLAVRDLARAVAALDVYATWSGPHLLEVMHPSVSKQDALARLAASLDVDRERVAAFGDNHNDIPMLAWAGVGVAVANASAEALEAADMVALRHDEEGVAALLETWFP